MFTTTELETLNKLLVQDTYQNMTDEEIDLLIEYKAEQKFFDRKLMYERAVQIEESNRRTEENRIALQMAEDAVRKTREMIESKWGLNTSDNKEV